nr:hypothetical protein [uncultured Steroidobacter sp.]
MVELSYLLIMGSLSGLVAVLAHSVLHSLYQLVHAGDSPASAVSFTDAFLHLVCGTGLGLLFWLSWGLAGIVDVPWWIRGLSFAMLCWVPVSLPAVIAAWLSAAPGLSTKTMALMASRWATTCLIAGLAFAWSWERSA